METETEINLVSSLQALSLLAQLIVDKSMLRCLEDDKVVPYKSNINCYLY